jgi:hypothetical protein
VLVGGGGCSTARSHVCACASGGGASDVQYSFQVTVNHVYLCQIDNHGSSCGIDKTDRRHTSGSDVNKGNTAPPPAMNF